MFCLTLKIDNKSLNFVNLKNETYERKIETKKSRV